MSDKVQLGTYGGSGDTLLCWISIPREPPRDHLIELHHQDGRLLLTYEAHDNILWRRIHDSSTGTLYPVSWSDIIRTALLANAKLYHRPKPEPDDPVVASEATPVTLPKPESDGDKDQSAPPVGRSRYEIGSELSTGPTYATEPRRNVIIEVLDNLDGMQAVWKPHPNGWRLAGDDRVQPWRAVVDHAHDHGWRLVVRAVDFPEPDDTFRYDDGSYVNLNPLPPEPSHDMIIEAVQEEPGTGARLVMRTWVHDGVGWASKLAPPGAWGGIVGKARLSNWELVVRRKPEPKSESKPDRDELVDKVLHAMYPKDDVDYDGPEIPQQELDKDMVRRPDDQYLIQMQIDREEKAKRVIEAVQAATPRRDDEVINWLVRKRGYLNGAGQKWRAVDELITDYRLHADTGTPLSEEAERYSDMEEPVPPGGDGSGD